LNDEVGDDRFRETTTFANPDDETFLGS